MFSLVIAGFLFPASTYSYVAQVISSLSGRALMGIIVSSALTVAPSDGLSQSIGLAQDYPFWVFPEFTLFSS